MTAIGVSGTIAADVVTDALTPPPSAASAVFRDPAEGGDLPQAAIDWLTGSAVPVAALGSATYWPITGTRALFLPNGSYTPSPLGAFCYRLAVVANGTVIDAVAWNPSTGELATRLGIGWALGQDQVLADDLGMRQAIPTHRSPIGWLRNSRFGIVILDYDRAAHCLAGLAVEGEDDEHQRDLRRRLWVPPPRVLSATRNISEGLSA